MTRAFRFMLSCACVSASAMLSCGDPVHDNQVAALGPEAPNVAPGPTHRPGQPCLTCHGGSGPGSPEMRFGGTVYAVRGQPDALAGVTVHLEDAAGASFDATTNGAGNFYVLASSWSPVMPVHVALRYQDQLAQMTTHVGRDGSCGTCHFEPAGRASPGRVYMFADPEDVPGATP